MHLSYKTIGSILSGFFQIIAARNYRGQKNNNNNSDDSKMDRTARHEAQ